MNNEGKITVFLSFILLVMMGLILTVLEVIDFQCAKTKVVTAVSSAASGIKGDYNSFIFERYHILLLDKDYEGSGEGKIEALIEDSLSFTLSDKFEIHSIELSGTTGILDGGCKAFKNQISDYIGYGSLKYTIEQLKGSTSEFDEPVKEDALSKLDMDVETEKGIQTGSSIAEENNEKAEDSDYEDPRMRSRFMSNIGIAYFIKPDNLILSDRILLPEELPSYGHQGINAIKSVAADFQDYDRLKKDVISCNGWSDSIISGTEAVLYAADVFNCATDTKYNDTYLNLEIEYLICGGISDADNYKKVVDRIVQLRLGVNFSYILTDAKKMSELSTLAGEISLVTLVPQSIVKYLLAGCWAYTEGVAEVYFLLRGEKIPYIKNAGNWITDLDSLSHLESLEKPDSDESGMEYKEYLLLLLLFDTDTVYYRMLDLIEVNTKLQYSTFEIENAITEFAVNVDVSYGGQHITVRKEVGY